MGLVQEFGTVEAELLSRTARHRATRAQLTLAGVEAFCKTIDAKPGERVYGLVAAVVRLSDARRRLTR